MQHLQNMRREPPLAFLAARWLQGLHVRGAHRLEDYARSRGWFDVTVRYRLGARASIDVPLRDRPYALTDLFGYERSSVEFLASELGGLGYPVALIDCGADIGLISARLVAACPRIRHVVALEPNEAIFGVLASNMRLLDVDARAELAAVADFEGQGELVYPPHSRHDHAAYLVPEPGGSVDVTTVDRQDIPGDVAVALKADVEGGEAAVLRGAERTLTQAPAFLVSFEAHRMQSQRARIEPIDLVRDILDLRPCDVYAVRCRISDDVESPHPVALDRPFFEQFAGNVYNVIAISR